MKSHFNETPFLPVVAQRSINGYRNIDYNFKRKKMNQPESKLQQSCVRWFSHQYPKLILAAFPNAQKRQVKISKTGKRYVPSANRQLAEGMLPGMPDLVLFKRKGLSGALFIEMKYGKNKSTDIQKAMHERLMLAGYTVAVCYSFDEFKKDIEEYLK